MHEHLGTPASPDPVLPASDLPEGALPESALTVVICFDHAAVTGGQARVAFDSAVALRKAGHRPIVFAAAGPVSSELSDNGIETICLDQLDLIGNPSKIAAAVQGIWNSAAAARLGSLLESLPRGRSIVHVHGWAKALSPSIAVPIRRSGLPAVYTIHEYFQFCPNGGFYNYQSHGVCRLQPMSVACWTTNCDSRSYPRKLWRNVRQAVAEHVAGLPTVFSDYVAISDFQREIVAPLIPKGACLHRIDNPVAVPDLGPKDDPCRGEAIFVGRLSPEKGAFLYAEAARRIGVRPVFVGNGPIAGEIASRYPEARMLGWLDSAGVRTAMRGARALVFPSLWYEGQPLTILEAKALGLPVIVSDACAGREAVADGITGLWFRSGDVDDLARAMLALRDDARIVAMSRAAHASYWAAPPTAERHAERIITLYEDILRRCAAAVEQPSSARPAVLQHASV